MKKAPLSNWPLYLSILVLAVLVWQILDVSGRQNNGHLVYALDDAYIHMAIARNLAQHGVWGVTRHAFTPASSSLLWTVLLSLTYYIGGVNQAAPLLLNLAAVVLVLVAANAIISSYDVPAGPRLATLLSMILFVPLPALVVSGMEQSLQTLLSMCTAFLAARLLSEESPATSKRDGVTLLLLAPLVTAVRFEGMFLVAAVCLFFVLRRQWRFASIFAFCGFLPVFTNAVVSVSKGWFWFPTSVILKATLPEFHSPGALLMSLVSPIYITLHESIHILTLLICVLLVYIMASERESRAFESRQVVGAILVLTGIAHLEFVGAGPLYRYDAYWCALALLFVCVQIPVVMPRLFSPPAWSTGATPKNFAAAALGLLIFFTQAVKGGRILWRLPQCTTNVFEQQYQMGLFVHRYYQGSAVALNDIGAVNFLSDIHCVDLWGLGNAEVAAARKRHSYQVSDIDRISKRTGTRIAIVYDSWFHHGLPPQWIRVGRWTIQNNVVLGADTVSFYAVDPLEAVYLSRSLTDFAPELPPDVIQQGQ